MKNNWEEAIIENAWSYNEESGLTTFDIGRLKSFIRQTIASEIEKFAGEIRLAGKIPRLSIKPDPQLYNQSEFFEATGYNQAVKELDAKLNELEKRSKK